MSELDLFLPSLDDARAAGLSLRARVWWRLGLELDLMDREPTDMRRLAAIVVRGRVLRRRRLAQRTDIPTAQARAVPEPMPRAPTDYANTTTTIFTEVLGSPQRCSHCRDGSIVCTVCGGEGVVEVRSSANQPGLLRGCPSCRRMGTHTCPHCAGTSETVEVRCVDIIDETVSLSYPYVPTMSFAVEEKVTTALEAELAEGHPTPPALLVDLEPQKSGGPYRQAVREPDFRGYSYADALDQARAAVARARGDEPLREEIEIHARPILWLRYEAWGARREVALFYDLGGRLHATIGDGGL